MLSYTQMQVRAQERTGMDTVTSPYPEAEVAFEATLTPTLQALWPHLMALYVAFSHYDFHPMS